MEDYYFLPALWFRNTVRSSLFIYTIVLLLLFSIDASMDDGSLGRRVNDDAKPNAKIWKLEVDGLPHLCLFAIMDIKESEGVTYDYGGTGLPWRVNAKKQGMFT